MTQLIPRCVLLALALTALALNGCGAEDGSKPRADAGVDAGTDGGDHGDAGDDAGDEPDPELTEPRGADASGQIEAVREVDGEDTTVEPPLPVEGVAVTHVRPQLGDDPAGFFVQGEAAGPALFVAVDPESLSPAPEVGDLVSFRVEATTVVHHQHRVTGLRDYTLRGSGYDVMELVQDLSAATDLISGLDGYESELVALEGTVKGALQACGGLSVCAPLSTAGLPGGDEGLHLRIPEGLVVPAGVRPGCAIAVGPTPLWRFDTTAQASAWSMEDLEVISCPALEVVSAIATGRTTLILRFSGELAPETVNAGAFTVVEGALSVTAAAVEGATVTLTTSEQEADAVYRLALAESIAGVDGTTLGADTVVRVEAFRAAAGVLVNEADLNAADGCDLIELRVIATGPMGGMVLRDRTSTPLFVFPDGFFARKNDLIVVHLGRSQEACHGGVVPEDELAGVDSVPHPSNFPGAYDFWAEHGDVDSANNVLFLLDAEGAYVDFVAFVAEFGTISAPQLDAANAAAQAGAWPLPAVGYYGTSDYRRYAVDYWLPPVEGTAQRTDDADTNNKEGWGQAPQTLGSLNAGQAAIP